MGIVGDNRDLFSSLQEDPTCYVNWEEVTYFNQLFDRKLINGIDLNMVYQMVDIAKFASEIYLPVNEQFLHADFNYTLYLSEFDRIGSLTDIQLTLLTEIMQFVQKSVEGYKKIIQHAISSLKNNLKIFTEATKKISDTLRKLHLTLTYEMSNAELKRSQHIAYLKSQIDVCLHEMSDGKLDRNIDKDFYEILRRMKYASFVQKDLPNKIGDVIEGRPTAPMKTLSETDSGLTITFGSRHRHKILAEYLAEGKNISVEELIRRLKYGTRSKKELQTRSKSMEKFSMIKKIFERDVNGEIDENSERTRFDENSESKTVQDGSVCGKINEHQATVKPKAKKHSDSSRKLKTGKQQTDDKSVNSSKKGRKKCCPPFPCLTCSKVID